MAVQDVVRLFRDVRKNAALKEKYNAAEGLEQLVEMAQADGYEITLEDWLEATQFQVEEMESSLSDIPGL